MSQQEMDQLRGELRQRIAGRLGWTPNEEKAAAWHEAVEAALDVAVPIEASRRDWAADAEAVARRYQDLLGAIWLYVDWRYVTKQLTTEQKNLWADAVDVFGDEADHGAKADRWWEQLPCGHTRAEAERSIRHELCAVHPEADR